MSIRPWLILAFASLYCLAPKLGWAEHVSAFVDIPHGEYVFSDNPPCGVDSSIVDVAKNPATIGAIGATFGPQAASVVLLVGQADEALHECGGGDACKAVRKVGGVKDHASCATICVRTPPGAALNSVGLSDRHGKITFNKTLNSSGTFDTITTVSQNDWSAWHDVVAGQNDERRWIVCGTATNWSASEPARKVLDLIYTPAK